MMTIEIFENQVAERVEAQVGDRVIHVEISVKEAE